MPGIGSTGGLDGGFLSGIGSAVGGILDFGKTALFGNGEQATNKYGVIKTNDGTSIVRPYDSSIKNMTEINNNNISSFSGDVAKQYYSNIDNPTTGGQSGLASKGIFGSIIENPTAALQVGTELYKLKQQNDMWKYYKEDRDEQREIARERREGRLALGRALGGGGSGQTA